MNTIFQLSDFFPHKFSSAFGNAHTPDTSINELGLAQVVHLF